MPETNKLGTRDNITPETRRGREHNPTQETEAEKGRVHAAEARWNERNVREKPRNTSQETEAGKQRRKQDKSSV